MPLERGTAGLTLGTGLCAAVSAGDPRGLQFDLSNDLNPLEDFADSLTPRTRGHPVGEAKEDGGI